MRVAAHSSAFGVGARKFRAARRWRRLLAGVTEQRAYRAVDRGLLCPAPDHARAQGNKPRANPTPACIRPSAPSCRAALGLAAYDARLPRTNRRFGGPRRDVPSYRILGSKIASRLRGRRLSGPFAGGITRAVDAASRRMLGRLSKWRAAEPDLGRCWPRGTRARSVAASATCTRDAAPREAFAPHAPRTARQAPAGAGLLLGSATERRSKFVWNCTGAFA